MKTSKPFSTISYNTKEFLIDTLNSLQYLKYIQYFEFIEHLPDEDDKKKHIHLYIEPNKSIDTETFKNYFIENDPLNPDKPFKIHHFQSSKYGDWYWYAIHDKDYLKAKMLTRNLHYSDKDIVTSDIDTHNHKVCDNPLINYANMSDIALRDYIFFCVNNGYSLQYLLNSCSVPLGKINSVIHFYNALAPIYAPNKEIINANIIPNSEQQKNIKKNQNLNNVNVNIQGIINGSINSLDDDPVF